MHTSTLTCSPAPVQTTPVAASFRRIRSPQQLKQDLSLSELDQHRIAVHRRQIRAVLTGQDERLLMVVGPCSIHDVTAAQEYASRLQQLNERVSDRLLLVMRAYFEKPRTTVGWKGLAMDPALDGSHDMDRGLELARRLLINVSRLGLPLATEALSPLVAEYLQDCVSWTAIGARTTESQTHRELASGLEAVVGFKNATDGGLQVAIDAIKSAAHSHEYLSVDPEGQVAIRQTPGNSHCHLVLRGAKGMPNYQAADIRRCREALAAAGLNARIMVDCSHDNSGKDYRRQPEVLEAVVEQIRAGERSLIGVMLESHLKEGQQTLAGPTSRLEPGQSVTDGCIGWETTERLILETYRQLGG